MSSYSYGSSRLHKQSEDAMHHTLESDSQRLLTIIYIHKVSNSNSK